MKQLFTLFLMTVTSSLTAQLTYPFTWKSDLRIARQYRLDTANYNSLPDTVRFYPATPVVFDSAYFTIGIDCFQIKKIERLVKSTDLVSLSNNDPTVTKISCIDGTAVTLWDAYLIIQYPAKNNWWRTVEYHLQRY